LSIRAKVRANWERSGHVNNLTGLRSRNDSFEVCVFAALARALLAFSRALRATLLLLLLLLSAGAFSLAFIHATCLQHDRRCGRCSGPPTRSRLITGPDR